MKQIFVILILYAVILTAACPSQLDVAAAEKSSAMVAVYANETVEVVRDLYRSEKITLDQKNRIADLIINLAKGGVHFTAYIAYVKNNDFDGKSVKGFSRRELFRLLETEIIGPTVDLLKELNFLKTNSRLLEMLSKIRETVIIISRAFSLQSQTAKRLAAAGGD